MNKKINTDIEILKSLNPEQQKATSHINGPLLIIAGAGSGKTRVLTSRVVYLIKNNVLPWNILALTFTNKAAKEMKHRIAELIDLQSADRVWAGTFHSIFARILRSEAELLGYNPYFSIYDADDQLSVIKKVMDLLQISKQQYSPQAIRAVISSNKNKMMSWRDFLKTADTPFDKKVVEVFKEYELYLKNTNAMDFDDLLLNMVKLLSLSNEILEKYQNKFKYILVDEYQDTNRVQYHILKLLAKAHQNICVVGDDAQSIYRWRGADIRNILDFQKDYPHGKTIRLEQNYRSTKTILKASNSVIKNNKNQIEKALWTENHEGDLIDVTECEDDRKEAEYIAKQVMEKSNKGLMKKDIAVLYRTNAQSLALENSFRMRSIPYVVVGGLSFFKRKEIKDVLSYIKLLINPLDNEALIRIVNEPPRGLGKTSIDHLSAFGRHKGISLFESFEIAEQNPNLQKRATKASKRFAGMINKYRELISSTSPDVLAKNLIEESGLIEMYEEISTDDSSDRLNNINQLLTDMSLYFNSNDELTLNDYLQQTSLATDYDEKDTSQDKVTLMTLHTAKGLEYEQIIIAGMEQGLFPLIRSEFSKDEEEEERRLFYVGLTRAKENLLLTYSRKRMKFGEVSNQIPSRFLEEIDSELLNFPNRRALTANGGRNNKKMNDFLSSLSNKKTPSKKNWSSEKKSEYNQIPQEENYSQINPTNERNDNAHLKVGDKVQHSSFGIGRISGLKGSGPKRQAVVRFDTVGRKMLMLKYAKLKIIE